MISRPLNGDTENAYSTCNLVGVSELQNSIEIAKDIACVYDQSAITDRQNWFSKNRSGNTSQGNKTRTGRSLDHQVPVV